MVVEQRQVIIYEAVNITPEGLMQALGEIERNPASGQFDITPPNPPYFLIFVPRKTGVVRHGDFTCRVVDGWFEPKPSDVGGEVIYQVSADHPLYPKREEVVERVKKALK